ncbi:hypothetical protein HYFRA_00006823 [Hymenoscyphus fraxineus]|uniref:Cell wall proline rich protein n=1 Tax=Hymenoscyphus fraxineus TaxID=746836 RepID=A0A9N9PNT5_9HELO|nr:hypothetical protein HYFRA_00006823 [Hymenoscyphus fraxineus]
MATTERGLSSTELNLRPMTAGAIGNSSPTMSDSQSPRLHNGPLPLPSFVFPAKPPPRPMSSSAPSSYSRASGRRPASAIDLKGPSDMHYEQDSLRTPELPAFSFGTRSSSPPSSPLSRNIPPRSGGPHQRGTSEFIGGDSVTGKSTSPKSASPPTGDAALPQPTGFGPPGGRRGHRHVRSAAISCHDITMILKPPTSPVAVTRGNSAPCSPAGDQEMRQPIISGSVDETMKAKVEETVRAPPTPETDNEAAREPLRALNRARVGFSDNVEVIPRPLSVISSDSSSTVTMRQGHSVSNSISSVMSYGNSPTPTKDTRGLTSTNRRNMDTRPRTAEPVLDRETAESRDSPKRRNSIPLLNEATSTSVSEPSTPRSAKKWTFFGHDSSNSGECSPKSRPTSSGSIGKIRKSIFVGPQTAEKDTPNIDPPMHTIEPTSSRRSSISRKPSKKQKKVRNWAGSILSRKTRQRSSKQKLSRRSPTPPQRSYPTIEETSRFDSTYPEYQAPVPTPEPDNDIASWKPRKLPPQEDDSASIMIDLDAALGPFNTPSSFGDEWETSQRTNTRKRAMHSAAGLGGFAGPGMHYHRRAESAPEFDSPSPRFGLHRLGSNSTMTMEDVFEEDEDEWEDAKVSSDKEDGNTGLGIDIKVEDFEDVESDKAMSLETGSFNQMKRKGSNLSEGDRNTVGTAKSEHSGTSLLDEPIMEESISPHDIVDITTSSRPDSRARSSDSTATPPFRPRTGKELPPVEIHQKFNLQPFGRQPPYLTPTSPLSATQSSFPSPRSPFSYDAQRISTAPSSVTDEQGFQSLLLGEPGPEVRHSVEEHSPSLSSINSASTRDTGYPNQQFRDGQRSASLSSAAVTRKRSSMASLSRLISSSHGEKSKLSIESRVPTEPATASEKKDKKGKRISRLMQFFKPKDTPAA